jgi:hypothetical protein
MESYGAITTEPAYDGYGVILRPGDMAHFVTERASLTLEAQRTLDRVCQFIRSKKGGQLERLATAAWIRTREGKQDTEAVATRLHQLKPHISLTEAREADQELLTFLQQGSCTGIRNVE